MSEKIIAMLLAGGQGSRLYALTNKIAKPAVAFGGKYRIIDFTLSNCANSGIETVGVLTQYQPLVLNEYIGNGEPWDLDRNMGGVHTLPPYMEKEGGAWYKGTANAIYQNMRFIDKYNPEHVIILSGDHIYRMNYSDMLEVHIRKGADITIAVLPVPIGEASRFGIMSYDENGGITDFEEKPKAPKSNNASMGIYIFKKDVLFEELIRDEADASSSKDFGKNIIPHMLASGRNMCAYRFEGYWKDVGTIESLWEANMDLLGAHPAFSLDSHREEKVYARNNNYPPQYVAPGASVKNSLVTSGCEIYGAVENSVISEGVTVEAGARVRDSVVMSGVRVGAGVELSYCIIDEGVSIGENVKIAGERGKIILV